MPTPMNFGMEFFMSLLVFGLVAKWYVWPYLRAQEFRTALLLLLSPFLVRYLGLRTAHSRCIRRMGISSLLCWR